MPGRTARLGIVILVAALPFAAKAQTHSVAGTIKDGQTNLPVGNVIVKILQTGDSTQTDANGYYFFPSIAAGSYTFLVGKGLYQPVIMTGVAVPGGCCKLRGDVSGDAKVNLVDLSSLISYLVGGPFKPPCLISADVNGDTKINLVDLSALINFLTGGPFKPPSCP